MIKTCRRCLVPSTRPRVIFNENSICNACTNVDDKLEIDWGKRREEFFKLVEENKGNHSAYDCIVPWSGGKDSSMIAYRLKHELGLNPLLITFSPMIPSEVGEHNREQMIKSGFDSIFVRPNQKVARHLAKRFFIERGNPKVCWDAGINSTPVRLAVELNIPLIFYAEHGESEYGGHVLSEEHKKQRDFAEVLEHQIGDDPNNWVDTDISERDLYPYIYPEVDDVRNQGVKAMYFAYFFKWDVLDNYKYISNKIDFKTAPNERTSGTFTNYDSLDDKIDNLYYYMQFVKFGFGRAVRDASRLIQLGHINREEALSLVMKFDDEFPDTYLDDVLDYLSMTRIELIEIIDGHRNPEIWSKNGTKWLRSFDVV